MVPTSVTSLLAHKLGQGSAGKTRPSSQDKYLNFIALAMEEVDMGQWLESGRMGRPGVGVTWKKIQKVNTGWTCSNAFSSSQTCGRPSLASDFMRLSSQRQKEHEDRKASLHHPWKGPCGRHSGPDGEKAGKGLVKVCSVVVPWEDTRNLQPPVTRDDPGSRRLYTQDLGRFKAEPIIS